MRNLMLGFIALLSACAYDITDHGRLKYLALAECADERASKSAFNRSKSHTLLIKECEQMQFMDERYQSLASRKFRRNRRLTYRQDQEYFNEQSWFLVTERMRELYYPDYLDPESEIARADLLNEQQAKREDRSIQRHYEPRLMPASPYGMSYRELDRAGIVIERLIHENWKNTALRRSLSSIGIIVLNEKSKRQSRGY